MQNKILLLTLLPILLLTGCDINAISIKMPNLEYQNTEQGWVLGMHNFTDILINDPQLPQASIPPSPELLPTNETPRIPGNLTQLTQTYTNLTEMLNESNESATVKIENNTIRIL